MSRKYIKKISFSKLLLSLPFVPKLAANFHDNCIPARCPQRR